MKSKISDAPWGPNSLLVLFRDFTVFTFEISASLDPYAQLGRASSTRDLTLFTITLS